MLNFCQVDLWVFLATFSSWLAVVRIVVGVFSCVAQLLVFSASG